jgi:cytoskeletal protein CcmA (bactofilin family)
MKGFLGSNSSSSGSNSSGGSSSKGAAVDTLIGRQTEVLGDVRFSGGLHVDGKIKGGVTTLGTDKSAHLSVSETGAIEGDVRVPTMMLNGTVTGNVYYKVLQMEPGAMINGQLMYEGSDQLAALTHQKQGGDAKSESTVLEMQDGRRAKAS